MKRMNKLIPIVLTILLVLGMLPLSALAEGMTEVIAVAAHHADSEVIAAFANEEDAATTANINVIAAREGYDGWIILYPEATGTTEVTVPYDGESPTALDVVRAVDPGFNEQLTNNRPTTFLGYTRGSDGYGNWSARKLSNGSYSNVSNFTTTNLAENDSIIIYLTYGATPTWDILEPLITSPIQPRTPEERLADLIAADCSWDKIKGANTDMSALSADLASLPSNLDSYALSLSWSTNESPYMSNSGKILLRPKLGEESASVSLTLSVKNGLMPNTGKYGDYPDYSPVKTYELKILPLSQAEIDASKSSVQAALAGIELADLKLMDGEAIDPDNVLYDIQLVDPRNYGDKTTDYISSGYWTSDNTDIITVNWMRAKVKRPDIGDPDATVKLTVIASKGGYTESKDFIVTVKAVTQAEIDAVNAEIDAVKEALVFEVIKNNNSSADAVTSNLQMVYRGLDYPAVISWATKNSGEKGIKIEWATSDSSTIASYGTVTRPSAGDKSVTMTATLTSFRLAEYTEARTVELPLIVRKVSNSADVAAISLSPSLGFTFNPGTKAYSLAAPAMVKSVGITVAAEETGTLITSGVYSARGSLAFDVELNADQTAVVTIKTAALDSDSTKEYVINITLETADAADTAVAELLAAIADSYKNTSGDWEAMAMAAYGRAGDVAGASIVENVRTVYTSGSTTDKARAIITLTALGVDASNVYSGTEGVYWDFVEKLGENAPSQAAEAAWGLIALDSGQYDDSGFILARQTSSDYLLENKLTPADDQTAWTFWGTSPDVDATAMVVAALAPYYNSNTDVKTAIDGALEYLAAQQKDSGHYGNSNSTSMVIVALTALGQDPSAETGDFAQDGKSLIEGLLAFRISSNQLGYDNNTTASSMSTEQGFRALVAYQGYLTSGKNAYNIYHFGAQTGDGTELTGETDPGVTPPDPSAPKNITVRVEDLYNGTTLMPQTSVEMSGTHLDALKAALTANGKDPDTDLTVSYGYVSAILGVSAGDTTGWMYAINGEIPVTMLSETQIAKGDSLVLFFIDWYDTAYLTKFDKATLNVKTGEAFNLKLLGIDSWDAMGSGGAYAPLNGATVYILDKSGNRVGTEAVTDADGNVTITLPAAGTYTISAARPGTINTTDLVPPLCQVTVVSSSSPPGTTITVYFTLEGMSSSGKLETWINRKAVTNITDDAAVSEVIIKALAGTGYTQSGAQNGYIKSITTPDGFTLSEAYNGMPNSGWLFKVNSKLPTVGIDSYIVKNGDHVLLYFTRDYTNDPDAGRIPGGNNTREEKPVVTSEIEVSTIIEAGVDVAAINSDAIKDALNKLEEPSDTINGAEVKIIVTGTDKQSPVRVEIKTDAIKEIIKANAQLTIASGVGTLTFDTGTLAGITRGRADDSMVRFVVTPVVNATLDNAIQKVVGNSPVFDLSIMVGDTIIHQFEGTATVFLPFSPAAGVDPGTLTVYYLDGNSNPVPMENARYDAERRGFVFTTNHFSLFYIGETNIEWINPYTDVNADDWFYDAVTFVSQKGLFSGTSTTTFSPNSPMTRAMLATVLYRLEGSPIVSGTNAFTDVQKGEWYTDAVIWSNASDIVRGYGSGLFGTNDNATREQTAAILYHYAKYKGYDVTAAANLKAFSDAESISSWAQSAMSWANAEGLINGRTKANLVPGDSASRAEVASILQRFVERKVK
jgi:hypothetical protein